MSTNLNEFITALQEVEPPANAWNHYSQRDSFGHIRQRNLWLHWQRMLSQLPTVLLLGEAVGYRGGRLTGLPFVSEQILLETALNRWRLPHAKVRHPSHGGKQLFQAGLTAVLDEST